LRSGVTTAVLCGAGRWPSLRDALISAVKNGSNASKQIYVIHLDCAPTTLELAPQLVYGVEIAWIKCAG